MKRAFWPLALSLTVVGVVSSPALADEKIFRLKNGRKIQGEVVEETATTVIIKSAGGTTKLEKSMIVKTEDAPPPEKTEPKKTEPDETPTSGSPSTNPKQSPRTTPTAPTTAPTKGKDGKERDLPDERGVVPGMAKLGGATEPVDTKGVGPAFKTALDNFMATNPAPEDITAWVKEKATLAADHVYVIRVAQTWTQRDDQRRALWAGWVARQRPEEVEAKLLPFVASDLWNTRMDACKALEPFATWKVSSPVLLKLLDLAHDASDEAACCVFEAMATRSRPTEDVVKQVAEHAAKGTSEAQGPRFARVLAAMASSGSPAASAALRSAFEKGDARVKGILLNAYLKLSPPEMARQTLLALVADTSPAGKQIWLRVVALMPDYCEFGDVFALARAFPDSLAVGNRDALVLNVTAALTKLPRFNTIDELKAWWDATQRIYENRNNLISDLTGGDAHALVALEQLMDIRIPDVDQAYRTAASRGRDPDVRAKACQAIARRGDRKGAPYIFDALRDATPATRPAVENALATLARGKALPKGGVDKVIDWWKQTFPADFE